ncbi:MAG: acyloxyacyl hydrolase [Desulfuromonadales bacterium]|nr:acyloxyacyl hydrolase [Desulfuromonadales bacterium]
MRWITFLVAIILLSPCQGMAQADEAEPFFARGNFRLLGDSRHSLQLSAGVFDLGNKYTSPAAAVELRFGHKLGFIGPLIGVMANTDGGVFAHAGIYADMQWRRLSITPAWSAGAYRQGNSRDLGGTLELRSALTLAWVFDRGSRLGVHLAHISNGKLHEKNPGENDVMLSYAFPF